MAVSERVIEALRETIWPDDKLRADFMNDIDNELEFLATAAEIGIYPTAIIAVSVVNLVHLINEFLRWQQDTGNTDQFQQQGIEPKLLAFTVETSRSYVMRKDENLAQYLTTVDFVEQEEE